MKIAFVGAQGVGKSTLVQRLLSIDGGHLVPEVARDCPYKIDTEADFRTEWWMVAHSILAEINAKRGALPGEWIVADRCVLDIAVYSRLVHERDPEAVTEDQLGMIERTIKNWLDHEPYDHIFLLTVDEEQWQKRDLNDGFRSLDLDWYRKLTAGFVQALKLVPHDTRIHTLVNDGSFEELVTKANTILAQLDHNKRVGQEPW